MFRLSHLRLAALVAVVTVSAAAAASSSSSLLRGGQRSEDVAPPVWPSSFSVSFQETTNWIITKYKNNGTMYYDYSNLRSRTDRSTGKHDRYCGTVVSDDTPCTHLVVNGVRYLNFPQRSLCCKCCTDAGGCGVVTPNWMATSNASYIGQSVVDGKNVNGWKIQGLQPNYWYQTTESPAAPVQLYQVPDATRDFDASSYYVGSLPDNLFTLPSGCSQECAKVAPLSVCAALK